MEHSQIELGRSYGFSWVLWSYYTRAKIYMHFRGEKEKAYGEFKNLYIQNPVNGTTYGQPNIKTSPLFDSIRDEPEFQEIVKDDRSQIPSRA